MSDVYIAARRLFEPFQHLAQKRSKFMLLHGDLVGMVLTKKMLEKIIKESESLVNCVEETAKIMATKIGVCLFASDAEKAMIVQRVLLECYY